MRTNAHPGMAAQARAALFSTTAFAGLLLSAPCQAQSAPADEANEVVVTGSRLARPDLSAASPLSVVGEADLKFSGNVTIENTLNQFPQLAGGQTSSVGNGGGAGILTANLRGLGATRTLVLVNGRRFTPAGANGLVDLSTIPDALVKRVEIITGGASAVYGSDAVAGAVNFILKDDLKGLTASYQYGQTTHDDGFSHKADITYGASLAENRGNITFSASYTTRDGVSANNRDFSRYALGAVGNRLVFSGSGNVPGARIGLSSAQLARLKGVDLTPAGACTAITGVVFGAAGVPQPYCTPESTFNFASYSYLERPLKRLQLSTISHYDLSDNVEAFGEAYYVNSKNTFYFSPDSFVPVTPGAASQTLLIPNYATNTILSPAVRQFFTDNAAIFDPKGTGTATVVGAGRSAREIGPRITRYESNSIALTGGLRGHFKLFADEWRWEAFFQYQRNRTDSVAYNVVSQTRLGLGLDTIVDTSGKTVCRNQILGCVPTSIFGLNAITPEAAAFLTPPRESTEAFTRKIAGGSLSGSLGHLPAGPVAVAMGMEYRQDSYDFLPSPMDLANEYGAQSVGAMGGSYNVKEVFGELRVPILADRPFAQTLAIEGASRYSDYSNIGGAFTWKIGGEYAPVRWIRIRSAYNRAIRAPSLNELYSPIQLGFQSGSDPCAVSQKPTAAQKQLCVKQGVPAADIDAFTQAVLGYNARGGGNPNLDAEKSKTFTVGTVISPPFIPGMNLTVDYFKVNVKGGIASVNATQTLSDCFRGLNADSPTCRAISRLPNGQIDEISTQTSNLAVIKARGIDAQVDQRLHLPSVLSIAGDAARMDLQVVASWLLERSQQVIPSQPAVDCAGRFGNGCTGTGTPGLPKFKLNMAALYSSGPVSIRIQELMLGAFSLYPGITGPVTHVPNYWYTNISGSVRVHEAVEITGGIDNLFDKQPPVLGNALAGESNTSLGLWDVVGRRFFIGARLKL